MFHLEVPQLDGHIGAAGGQHLAILVQGHILKHSYSHVKTSEKLENLGSRILMLL